MPIYDRPTRSLMHDMVRELGLQPGHVVTRDQITEWFGHNYPRIKRATVLVHLMRMSTNVPTGIHHSPKPDDDLFFQLDSTRFRLYDKHKDPQPIHRKAPGGIPINDPALEPGDEEPSGSGDYAYESDLRDYLARNLQVIEPGLSLYEHEGVRGIEYPVGGRYIDILAIDSTGTYVVIELKVSRGYDRVIGQLLRYMGWIGTNLADNPGRVRGVIIARDISSDLKLACCRVQNVELYEYHLSVSLQKASYLAVAAAG